MQALEDEAHLAVTEDRQDRVGDRADARTGEVQRRHVPPVRQLERDDVAGLHAQLEQTAGESVGSGEEVAIAEDIDGRRHASGGVAVADDRDFVRVPGGGGRDVVVERGVAPPTTFAVRRRLGGIDHDIGRVLAHCRLLIGVLSGRRTVRPYRRTVDSDQAAERHNTAVTSQRLVGRERELGDLTMALERAEGGSGAAFIVAGAPGIGKTRLATELAAAARAAGVGVHWGRCWQGGVAPAFWPWVQVLRSMQADDRGAPGMVTDVLALIGPGPRPSSPSDATIPADGFVVLDQLAVAVSAAARATPRVVVIDDLQWADASSLQAFAHIATAAVSCPLLVVATLRSTDEAGRTDLGELARFAGRVEIGALSDEDVGELLAMVLGAQPDDSLLDRVREACGGNPFYIRAVAESARHGDSDALPASVRAVVRGQLASLDESTRSLITVASVLGHEFTTSALASIAHLDVSTTLDAIAQAERGGVVRALSFGTRYAFVHDLVREAIYGGLSARDRAAIHRRAAADMADHDDDFQVTARAHHALAAVPVGEVVEAVALATAAGNRSRDRLAFDEAARWYRRAHDAASADSSLGSRTRVELLLAEGAALRSVLSPRAEDVLAEAAVEADGLGDVGLLQRVVVTWVYRHGGAVFGPGLRQWVVRALETLPDHDMPLHARLLGAAAIVTRYDDSTRAWELVRVAKEMAAATSDDGASLDVAIAELYVFWSLAPPGRTWSDRALRIGDGIEELARRKRDAGALADATSWRVEVALRMGDLPTAERALILLESSPFGPTVVAQIMASIHRGAIAGLQADLSSVRAATARARRLAAAIDVSDAPVAMMEVAHRYVFGRDDPKVLEEALAAAVSLAAPHMSMAWTPIVRSMMSAFAAAAGDVERAQKLLPPGGVSLLRWGGTIGGIAAVFLSEVAAACPLPDLAEATYRWLQPAAGQLMYNGVIWTVFGSADHFLGRCASTLGRVDDAERHFAAALAIEQRLGAPHLQARTHLRLAELRPVRDDPIRTSHLAACLALCDEHHFTYLRSCAETFADSGPEQRRSTGGGRPRNESHHP